MVVDKIGFLYNVRLSGKEHFVHSRLVVFLRIYSRFVKCFFALNSWRICLESIPLIAKNSQLLRRLTPLDLSKK